MNDPQSTAQRSTLPIPTVGWLAAAIGLLSATWFVVRGLTKVLVFGGFGAVSRDVTWMAPLAHLLWFGLAGGAVWLLTRLLPRSVRLQVGAGLLAALAIHAVLLPWTQIGIYSALFLALGAGMAVARRLTRDGEAALVGRLKRVVGGLVLLFTVVLVGQGIWGVLDRPERTEPGRGPNVLLVLLDTFRASSMAAYGSAEGLTPALDSLAGAGARFEWAISNAGWTLPAHATLFTGRYQQALSTDFERALDSRDLVLAEAFGTAGYATAGFVGNLHYTTWESGLARGFDHFEDYPRSWEMLVKSTLHGQTVMAEELLRATSRSRQWRALRRKRLMVQPKPEGPPVQAAEITDRFLHWHEAREAGRPWFAFLNYFDAHRPYLAPAPYQRQGVAEDTTMAGYRRDVQYMDGHIGRMLGALRARGDLDSTVILVVADHGEHFGEHRLFGHANSLYTPLVHVPLFVVWPGQVPRAVVRQEVSLRDVPATLAELAGLPPGLFPGVSLASTWRDSGVVTSPAIAQHLRTSGGDPANPASEQGMTAVFLGEWQHIRTMKRALEEAFHYRTDRLDAVNLSGTDSAEVGREAAWEVYRRAIRADTARRGTGGGRG